jgi:YgiT-type zinc finger domain-containing protein
MNCHYCQGIDTYQQVKTRYFSSSHEHALFVDNFPVSECIQCGEQILSSAAMDVLDSIHDGEGNPISFETIPVYDHDDLAGYSRRSQLPLFAKMPDNVRVVLFADTKGSSLVGPIRYVVADSYGFEPFLRRIAESPYVFVSRSPEVRYPQYSAIRN